MSLFLLDTNLPANSETDRQLTARLYSNDLDVRMSQEIILGVGGVRALRRLGYDPQVWHMNEGHSAFLALERALELVHPAKPLRRPAKLSAKQTCSPPTRRFQPGMTNSRCGWLINIFPRNGRSWG